MTEINPQTALKAVKFARTFASGNSMHAGLLVEKITPEELPEFAFTRALLLAGRLDEGEAKSFFDDAERIVASVGKAHVKARRSR